MLHVEGGEIVHFFSCGGVGHVEGGEIVRFFSCGGMGHVERAEREPVS